jgi:hypothetical protein
MERNEYRTNAMGMTLNGPVFYCYNENRIDLYEFLSIEDRAYIDAYNNENILLKKLQHNGLRGEIMYWTIGIS